MKVKYVDIDAPFKIKWVSDLGFGEFTFYKQGDDIICDNECMDRESVANALRVLADECMLKDREDES